MSFAYGNTYLNLKRDELYGEIEYHYDSHSFVVRIYIVNEKVIPTKYRLLTTMSYGNEVAAEDALLDLMEYPALTALRYL